jgi:hypothetical protein
MAQNRPRNVFLVPKAPDLSQAHATMQAAGQKAGAYFSSWGAWAAEKRRTGWAGKTDSGPPSPQIEQKQKFSPAVAGVTSFPVDKKSDVRDPVATTNSNDTKTNESATET